MRTNNQRKKINYFIKQDLQGRLSWHIFLLSLLCLISFCLIFALVSTDRLSIIYDGQQLQVDSMPSVLLQELLRSNWLIFLVIGTIVVLATIILSHRIAGPIYHFEQVIKKMCTGDFSQQIVLRNHDNGRDLAAEINRLNRTLSADLRTIAEYNRTINRALRQQDLDPALVASRQLNDLLGSYQLHEEQENS